MSSNVFPAPASSTIPKTSDTLLARYKRQLRLGPDQLREASLRRIHYELDLPADERQRAILDRLRAWLALEPKEARSLAVSFKDALRLISADEKNELDESQRDAVYNALTFVEFEQLAGLVPSLNKTHADGKWPMLPLVSPYAFIAAAMSGASV